MGANQSSLSGRLKSHGKWDSLDHSSRDLSKENLSEDQWGSNSGNELREGSGSIISSTKVVAHSPETERTGRIKRLSPADQFFITSRKLLFLSVFFSLANLINNFYKKNLFLIVNGIYAYNESFNMKYQNQ